MAKYLYEITKICKEALLAQFCIYRSFLSVLLSFLLQDKIYVKPHSDPLNASD